MFLALFQYMQKQLSRGILRTRCSGNMQQIYQRIPMPKCDFNKVAFIEITFWHGCSPVNLLHISRTSFQIISGPLLLYRFQNGFVSSNGLIRFYAMVIHFSWLTLLIKKIQTYFFEFEAFNLLIYLFIYLFIHWNFIYSQIYV